MSEEFETGSHQHRFSGIERLYGKNATQILRQAHVLIVGVGGVGCWAAEALARTGLGKITLLDWDDICFSNSNRQIHAMNGTAGQAKVDVMAERIKLINPECEVNAIRDFYTKENSDEILSGDYDYVIDAIDSLSPKCHLIAACRDRKLPMVVSGSAGGRLDPGMIQVCDLNRSINDPLLSRVRKKLRQDFRFPKYDKKKYHIECVYTPEFPVAPEVCELAESDGPRSLDCQTGFGTATFITGIFGFRAGERAVAHILKSKQED